METSDKYLNILKKAFADAYQIDTYNLTLDHIKKLEFFVNFYGDLIIEMPLCIVSEINITNNIHYNSELAIILTKSMDKYYFSSMGVTLESLKEYLNASLV